MAANPPLVQTQGGPFPAPYQGVINSKGSGISEKELIASLFHVYAGEWLGLVRPNVELKLEGLRTHSGVWKASGDVFLSNLRVVFISRKRQVSSGLQAFEFPLTFIPSGFSFNQPIFGANNLTGHCIAVDDRAHRLKWTIYFSSGGFGTFVPLFTRLATYAERAAANHSWASEQEDEVVPSAPPSILAGQQFFQSQAAFVDPNDPSQIILTQPVEETQRLQQQPPYPVPKFD